MKDVEVIWEKPESAKWQSALHFEQIDGLRLDNFFGGPAKAYTDTPALVLEPTTDPCVEAMAVEPNFL